MDGHEPGHSAGSSGSGHVGAVGNGSSGPGGAAGELPLAGAVDPDVTPANVGDGGAAGPSVLSSAGPGVADQTPAVEGGGPGASVLLAGVSLVAVGDGGAAGASVLPEAVPTIPVAAAVAGGGVAATSAPPSGAAVVPDELAVARKVFEDALRARVRRADELDPGNTVLLRRPLAIVAFLVSFTGLELLETFAAIHSASFFEASRSKMLAVEKYGGMRHAFESVKENRAYYYEDVKERYFSTGLDPRMFHRGRVHFVQEVTRQVERICDLPHDEALRELSKMKVTGNAYFRNVESMWQSSVRNLEFENAYRSVVKSHTATVECCIRSFGTLDEAGANKFDRSYTALVDACGNMRTTIELHASYNSLLVSSHPCRDVQHLESLKIPKLTSTLQSRRKRVVSASTHLDEYVSNATDYIVKCKNCLISTCKSEIRRLRDLHPDGASNADHWVVTRLSSIVSSLENSNWIEFQISPIHSGTESKPAASVVPRPSSDSQPAPEIVPALSAGPSSAAVAAASATSASGITADHTAVLAAPADASGHLAVSAGHLSDGLASAVPLVNVSSALPAAVSSGGEGGEPSGSTGQPRHGVGAAVVHAMTVTAPAAIPAAEIAGGEVGESSGSGLQERNDAGDTTGACDGAGGGPPAKRSRSYSYDRKDKKKDKKKTDLGDSETKDDGQSSSNVGTADMHADSQSSEPPLLASSVPVARKAEPMDIVALDSEQLLDPEICTVGDPEPDDVNIARETNESRAARIWFEQPNRIRRLVEIVSSKLNVASSHPESHGEPDAGSITEDVDDHLLDELFDPARSPALASLASASASSASSSPSSAVVTGADASVASVSSSDASSSPSSVVVNATKSHSLFFSIGIHLSNIMPAYMRRHGRSLLSKRTRVIERKRMEGFFMVCSIVYFARLNLLRWRLGEKVYDPVPKFVKSKEERRGPRGEFAGSIDSLAELSNQWGKWFSEVVAPHIQAPLAHLLAGSASLYDKNTVEKLNKLLDITPGTRDKTRLLYRVGHLLAIRPNMVQSLLAAPLAIDIGLFEILDFLNHLVKLESVDVILPAIAEADPAVMPVFERVEGEELAFLIGRVKPGLRLF